MSEEKESESSVTVFVAPGMRRAEVNGLLEEFIDEYGAEMSAKLLETLFNRVESVDLCKSV